MEDRYFTDKDNVLILVGEGFRWSSEMSGNDLTKAEPFLFNPELVGLVVERCEISSIKKKRKIVSKIAQKAIEFGACAHLKDVIKDDIQHYVEYYAEKVFTQSIPKGSIFVLNFDQYRNMEYASILNNKIFEA